MAKFLGNAYTALVVEPGEDLGLWPPEPGLPPRHAGYPFLLGPQHREDAKSKESKAPVMYWSKAVCCEGHDVWHILVAINHLPLNQCQK